MRLPFAAFFQHRALLLVSMQATIVHMFDVNGKWVNWGKDEKSMEQVRTCRSVMNFNPTQIDPCHGSRKAKPVAQPTLLLNLLRCRQAQGETTATT